VGHRLTDTRQVEAACYDPDHDLAILAVDDDQAVLSALQRLLRSTDLPVVTAETGADALVLLAERASSVGVMVTDYAMPGMNGVDLLRTVRHQWPDIARVLLTGQADVGVAARAVNEGQLVHFFTKPWQATEVRSALVKLMEQQHARLHQRDQPGSVRELLLEIASAARLPAASQRGRPQWNLPPLAPLTTRERQVLQHIAGGQTNRQIAASLNVSPATARNHVEHILRKLEVADRTQAAVRALELGLLDRAA
jgi:DNA-binding NarL/FixJ family response regulator